MKNNIIRQKAIAIFQFILVFLLTFSGIDSADNPISSSNFSLSSRLVRTGEEQLTPTYHKEKIVIYRDGQTQEGNIRVDTLPDGELRIQIIEPSKVVGAKIRYEHSFKNANDYMEILLTLGTLKQYNA